jgi:hypothetical protein
LELGSFIKRFIEGLLTLFRAIWEKEQQAEVEAAIDTKLRKADKLLSKMSEEDVDAVLNKLNRMRKDEDN